jgi:AcrR family transcriptional regulator
VAAEDSHYPSVFFEVPEVLPRGQHGLSRDEVKRVQRERVLRAFTDLLAEHGYAKLRIAWVCERAGVSHATFYELFGDKEACVCEAYDRYIQVVWREASIIGVPEAESWRSFIKRSLDVYFDVLAAAPNVARAFNMELRMIGPRAGARQKEALHRFAKARMAGERRLRESDPRLLKRPFSAHIGSVQVQRVLAREALEEEDAPQFRKLRAELLEWFVAAWYGDSSGT